MILVERIHLPVPGIGILQAEARAEGYKFLEKLVDDWVDGSNRFDGPGEGLFGCKEEQGQLIAVGGLNQDPFAGRADTGRIRRVYVRRAWRNQGVGRVLVSTLIEESRKGFRCVRLRAENADAARLYERLGFVPITNPDATHVMVFA